MAESKILAILQNLWFRDPEGARAIFAAYPDKRNNLIGRFLFMGCLTGRRLQTAFGEELCGRIVWEEAHPEIGGHSGSRFGFDADHIQRAIQQHEPDVVLAFGKVAGDGLRAAQRLLDLAEHSTGFQAIFGPHPAARQDPMPALREIAQQLKEGTEKL
jgi:hypothetical protein